MSIEEKKAELVKPIYEDGLQPAVQELGQGLKAVLSLLMAPWKVLGIASDAHLQAFKEGYEAKIKDVPTERLITPSTQIAGNVLNVLAYTVQEDELRSMFEKLLATASDSAIADKAHPSFVEVIKQLNPKEAETLKNMKKAKSFAMCEIFKVNEDRSMETMHRNIITVRDSKEIGPLSYYIDNWIRLRLFEIHYDRIATDNKTYENLHDHVKAFYPEAVFADFDGGARPRTIGLRKGLLTMTEFGVRFFEACVE